MFKAGKRVSHPALALIVVATPSPEAHFVRLGVLVGRNIVRDAVPRNRLRRILRESFRTHAGSWFGRSLDCILLARPPAKSFKTRADADAVVEKLLTRL